MAASGGWRLLHCLVGVTAVLLLVLCASVSPAQGYIDMVVGIHRHGSRTVLSKNVSTLQEGGGVTLTPKGQRQLYDVGTQFRLRYINDTTCNASNTCLYDYPGDYSAQYVHVESSGLDRTLVSSEAFLMGLFPPTGDATEDLQGQPAGIPGGYQLVPIYSTNDTNDWILRAYYNCPTFLANLANFYNSTAYAEEAAATQDLRSYLQHILNLPTMPNVVDMYNIFDQFNVWQDERLGIAQPTISSQGMSNLTAAANWLETNRYSRANIQNLGAGPLLAQVLDRINSAITEDQTEANSLILYSSHYPVLLSFLALFDLGPGATTWQTEIPAYGALMVIELHTDYNGLWAIKLIYQDGPGAPYLPIPLPCTGSARQTEVNALTGSDGACELSEFINITASQAYPNSSDWCQACNNNAMNVTALESEVAAFTCGNNGVPWKVALTAVLCFFGGVLATAAAAYMLMKKQERRWKSLDTSGAVPVGTMSATA
eukprot:jgi/Chlat1/8719/Chrsp9S00891